MFELGKLIIIFKKFDKFLRDQMESIWNPYFLHSRIDIWCRATLYGILNNLKMTKSFEKNTPEIA